jgi:hypothetical protein
LKPAWANSLRDPILKNHHKKGLVEWLKVKALSSNPSTEKKKKKTLGMQLPFFWIEFYFDVNMPILRFSEILLQIFLS